VPVVLYSGAEFSSVTSSHNWVGALYDGKIRVPLTEANHSEELAKVLAHEYTHFVVSRLSKKTPAWMNEGLAQYQEEPGAGIPEVHLRLLRSARDDGDLKPIASLKESFAGVPDRDHARLLYAQSLGFVAYLVDRYGMSSIREFLVATGRGDGVDKAFNDAFGDSMETADRLWRESL